MASFNIKEDIKAALIKYSGLKLDDGGEAIIVKGDIDVLDPKTLVSIDTFSVELSYPPCFPYCFPFVIETSNKIPRTLDRHVFVNDGGILCLAVKPDEKLQCARGITTLRFLDRVLVPRLAEEYVVNNGGKYEHEYPHTKNAIWEFYMKLLNVQKPEKILPFFDMLINNNLPKGFWPCTCGSAKKFKQCHLQNVVDIGKLGTPYLKEQYKWLMENQYKQ